MPASSASISWGGSFSARPASTTIRPAWLRHYFAAISSPCNPLTSLPPGQADTERLRLFLAALHGLVLSILTRLVLLGLRLFLSGPLGPSLPLGRRTLRHAAQRLHVHLHRHVDVPRQLHHHLVDAEVPDRLTQ